MNRENDCMKLLSVHLSAGSEQFR